MGVARTAWIERWTLDGWPVWDEDGAADLRQLDRFGCRWEQDGPAGHRTRFGPSCVPLADALAWAAEHAGRTLVAGVDGVYATDGTVPIGLHDEGWSVAWDLLPSRAWCADVRMSLGLRDYEVGVGRLDHDLGDAVAWLERVDRDDEAGHVHATVLAKAPTAPLAGDLAAHHLRRVLTDGPDGLADELGDGLAVRVVRVSLAHSERL